MVINLSKSYTCCLIACSLLLGAGYQNRVQAQERPSISVSLIPQFGFNFSYYHLTSKTYRNNFKITTNLGASRNAFLGLGLQLGLWDEWKATLTIGETLNGGKQVYSFSRFPNLPKDALFAKGLLEYGFPVGLFTFNFSKKLWRFNMGAIKGNSLTSELEAQFGAGVLWINKSVYEDAGVYVSRPLSNEWQVYKVTSFVATPANNMIGIVNLGFTYNLFINNKARFVFAAQYTYGLQASYDVAYKTTYGFENFVTNYQDSSVEDFNAETGRHQFTLSIGYPIALYRNKAAKKALKEEASPNLR